MAQSITLMGATYPDVPSILLPKSTSGMAQFDDTTISSNAAAASDITSGKLAYVNGALITGTNSGGGGSSKNAQVVQGTTRTNASTLTAIGAELTVSKAGTYDIYYSCFRTNTSSSYTWGTRLYIDGTAHGSENTTWTNNQQNNHLTNVSLTSGQKLRVYGRETRGTSYYICVPMLAIIEV